MLKLLVGITIIVQSFVIGFICGYNHGWDDGHKIGLIDARLKFTHTINGVVVE